MLLTALSPLPVAQGSETGPAYRDAAPAHFTRTDRYTLAAITPTRAQNNPLQAVIEIAFSSAIGSVGSALRELLADTGYSLNETGDITAALYRQPLPTLHTTLGPITVLQALQVLIGSAWAFEVDPVMRVVSPYLAEQHHLRAAELARQAHRPSVAEGDMNTHYVAFPLDNTTTPLPPGERALVRAAKAFLQNQTGRKGHIKITGISHSQGTTATHALALGRAEHVRVQLINAGIPENRIVLDTEVRHRSAQTRAGANVTVLSQPETEAQQTTVPSSLARTRLPYLQIEPGSLRSAVEHIVAEHGYQIARWQVEPIAIEIGFAVRNDRIEHALDDLLRPYPVSAQIIRHTHKIVVTGRPE